MIDFHNHVVPRVDDGAKSMDVALDMLRNAVSQGVTEVVATPHRQHPKFEMMQVTDEMVMKSFKELQDEVGKNKIPLKLHLGAEVYFQANLVSLVNHPFAVLGDYSHLLVEFSTQYLPRNYLSVFNSLMELGVTPIMAHPERYIPIHEDFSLLRKLFKAGMLIQLDAGSLTGSLGPQSERLAKKILSKGLAHFIGSDAHNLRKRNFCIEPAREIAHKIIGNDVELLVEHNPWALIYGGDIISITQRNSNLFSKLGKYLYR